MGKATFFPEMPKMTPKKTIASSFQPAAAERKTLRRGVASEWGRYGFTNTGRPLREGKPSGQSAFR